MDHQGADMGLHYKSACRPNVREVIVSTGDMTSHNFVHLVAWMAGIFLLSTSLSQQNTVSRRVSHTILTFTQFFLPSWFDWQWAVLLYSEGGRHFPFFVLVASCGQLWPAAVRGRDQHCDKSHKAAIWWIISRRGRPGLAPEPGVGGIRTIPSQQSKRHCHDHKGGSHRVMISSSVSWYQCDQLSFL